jgi:hypothetical protein
METADMTVPGRPFKPGQSGNPAGRPKGARSILTKQTEELLAKLTSGPDAEASLTQLRQDKPDAFWRSVITLLPKEVHANIDGELRLEVIERIIVKAPDKNC